MGTEIKRAAPIDLDRTHQCGTMSAADPLRARFFQRSRAVELLVVLPMAER